MPATIVTRSDTSKAIRSITAVFLRERRNGKDVYIRQPYNLVHYYRGHQTSGSSYEKVYYQPIPGMTRPGSEDMKAVGGTDDNTSKREEVYDDIMFLDKPDYFAPIR